MNHLGDTPYFREVRKAFNFPEEYISEDTTKRQVLWLLAQQGVLLLDLYPFAIEYTSTIRDDLNDGGVSAHFWGNAPVAPLAPETIGSRINALTRYFHPDGVKLAFMAPPKLSHFLAHNVSPNGGILNRHSATIKPGFDIKFPKYICACYDGAGNPNSLFIQNALLP